MTPKIFIGWDADNAEAYEVCRGSLLEHSGPLSIEPLIQQDLRDRGIYSRPRDHRSTTEFSLTRFLVPYLSDYRGISIYMDPDFLWLDSVHEMLAEIQPLYPVSVVQHRYTPTDTYKKLGKIQWPYPRKNWSSLMVFDCQRLTVLDLERVNSSEASDLHQFRWIPDHQIGSIDPVWNWLEGWYHEPDHGRPRAIHFTRGGPWYQQYRDVEYADLWIKFRDRSVTTKDTP